MSTRNISRRDLLRSAAVTAWIGAAGLQASQDAVAARRGGLPVPLTAEETSAIDSALGKKGSMTADQGVYTVPLPRNDLKVTVLGDRVPTSFGFGGWVSIKKTRDGKGSVLMSDTVLL